MVSGLSLPWLLLWRVAPLGAGHLAGERACSRLLRRGDARRARLTGLIPRLPTRADSGATPLAEGLRPLDATTREGAPETLPPPSHPGLRAVGGGADSGDDV